MTGADLQIWPGTERIYRLVIAYADGDYETVSEHDDAADAVVARFRAEAAAKLALRQLEGIAA